MKFLEEKKFFTLTTIIGLVGVGVSYYFGIKALPEGPQVLWGNTAENLKPFFLLTTALAIIGFAVTVYFLLFKTDLMNYYPISRSVIVILVASMLWMPYMVQMIENPASFTWIKIRIVLLLVGLGAWFLFRRIMILEEEDYGLWRKLAVVGSGLFFFHTFVMDAVLWPYLY